LRRGDGGEHGASAASREMRSKSRSTRFGSKRGEVAITSTRPVFGWIATAEPQFEPSACCAIRCAPARMVSTTLLPVTVAPVSWSSVLSKTVPRFALEAVR
jgi:hypothetical protein